MSSASARALRALRRQGPGYLLQRAREQVAPRLFLHEQHVWLSLDLDQPRPRPALPPGFELVRGSTSDLPVLDALGIGVARAGERLATGTELWLVRHGEQVVYAGWVFHAAAPSVAGPDGQLRMPPGVVNPEDMVTAPAFQGRGLASAAYAGMFDDLQAGGRATRVVGKIPVGNAANRRAVQKVGWHEFAVVDHLRVGPWRRVRVRARTADEGPLPPEAAQMTAWLAAAHRR